MGYLSRSLDPAEFGLESESMSSVRSRESESNDLTGFHGSGQDDKVAFLDWLTKPMGGSSKDRTDRSQKIYNQGKGSYGRRMRKQGMSDELMKQLGY